VAENLRNLTAKLRRLVAELPHLPRTLALVWDAAPYWTALWLGLLILQGLLPAATEVAAPAHLETGELDARVPYICEVANARAAAVKSSR